MSDDIDRTLAKGFSGAGLFRADAFFREVTSSIPMIDLLSQGFYDIIDNMGISNKAYLEKWNRENPTDQIHNPYSDAPAQDRLGYQWGIAVLDIPRGSLNPKVSNEFEQDNKSAGYVPELAA